MPLDGAPAPGPQARPAEDAIVPCTMREFLLYFLRLGTLGFGGPIALAGAMQRDLVDGRRWISKQDYLEGLALAQLMPGPLAAQLAMYLGWVRARVLGATLVAICFVLPSWVMVLALSLLYVRYGGLAWMQGAFYGIGAAVIAIIARSAVKLVRMTVQRDKLLWGIFAVMLAVTAWTSSEIVWLFLACGLLALVVRAPRFSPRPRAAAVGARSLGGAFTRSETTPHPRNSQTISVAVVAVTAIIKRKMPQRSRSRCTVIRTSFTALRAMMAMTAAPIP